jgi:prepilin-type N-terminal cleavage/methylation domain-containing protein
MRNDGPSLSRRNGFTLIEVLAVVFLTALVLGVALDFYTDLSNANIRAAGLTRELRQATAVLDRIARDFQGTMYATVPAGADPLYHGWRFLGEEGGDLGADRVLFVTTNHRPRTSDLHRSEYAAVAYITRPAEDDTLELLRSSRPHRPENGGLELPFEDDESLLLLAEGVHEFGVTFLADDGAQTSSWDSNSLVQSNQLPRAVEISLALAPDPRSVDALDREPRTFRRIVLLPMPAIDLVALLDPLAAAGGQGVGGNDDQDGDGIPDADDPDYVPSDDDDPSLQTVGYCVNSAALANSNPTLLAIYQKNLHQPFANFANIELPDGTLLRDSAAVNPACQ